MTSQTTSLERRRGSRPGGARLRASLRAGFAALAALVALGPLRAQTPPPSFTLTLPGLTWALRVPTAGCEARETSIAPDRSAARFHAEDTRTGMVVAGFLERAAKPGGARECREHHWSKAKLSPSKKENVKFAERGPLALVEYSVRPPRGRKTEQKNINAYLAKDGFWMEVHIAKDAYTTNDIPMLQALINGIAIDEGYTPTARDHLLAGNAMCQAAEYRLAIAHFEKARALEQIRTTLRPAEMVELLLGLGVAYGAHGQLDTARRILSEGLERDPEHPMLHYNLACTYAETGDLDRALAELRLAHRYRSKLPSGARLPDPLKDASFASYAAKPEFRAALKAMSQ